MVKFTSRIVLAYMALRGKFDDQLEVVKLASDLAQQVGALRKNLGECQNQRDYWYLLWFTMGREFEAGQNLLIDKIDELRRKTGDHDGKSYLEGLAQKGFHDKFVEPKSHPAAGVKIEPGTNCSAPPKPFAAVGCVDPSQL